MDGAALAPRAARGREVLDRRVYLPLRLVAARGRRGAAAGGAAGGAEEGGAEARRLELDGGAGVRAHVAAALAAARDHAALDLRRRHQPALGAAARRARRHRRSATSPEGKEEEARCRNCCWALEQAHRALPRAPAVPRARRGGAGLGAAGRAGGGRDYRGGGPAHRPTQAVVVGQSACRRRPCASAGGGESSARFAEQARHRRDPVLRLAAVGRGAGDGRGLRPARRGAVLGPVEAAHAAARLPAAAARLRQGQPLGRTAPQAPPVHGQARFRAGEGRCRLEGSEKPGAVGARNCCVRRRKVADNIPSGQSAGEEERRRCGEGGAAAVLGRLGLGAHAARRTPLPGAAG